MIASFDDIHAVSATITFGATLSLVIQGRKPIVLDGASDKDGKVLSTDWAAINHLGCILAEFLGRPLQTEQVDVWFNSGRGDNGEITISNPDDLDVLESNALQASMGIQFVDTNGYDRTAPLEKRVQFDRERFANGPVGCWTQANGTFSMVLDQDWTFREDGTGEIIDRGPFRHVREKMSFVWEPVGVRRIKYRITDTVTYGGDGEEEADVSEDEEDELGLRWVEVEYDFELMPNETGGKTVVMRQLRDGKPCEGFGDESLSPLEYTGPISALGEPEVGRTR